jgi:hypothetical protein
MILTNVDILTSDTDLEVVITDRPVDGRHFSFFGKTRFARCASTKSANI